MRLKILFLLMATISLTYADNMVLEVETFQGVGQAVIPRTNASNGHVAHLLHDHIVRYEMCVHLALEISIKDIVFSNSVSAGKLGDEVSVFLDDKLIGTFQSRGLFSSRARSFSEWNEFKHSGPIGSTYLLDNGRHYLSLWATDADSFGIELDYINIDIGSATMINPGLECTKYCFDTNTLRKNAISDRSGLETNDKQFQLQKYVKATVCAEEENVKVGFYHDGETLFQIKATRPMYDTCSNNRDADFRGCKLASPAWEFQDVPLELADESTIVRNTTRATLTVDSGTNNKRVAVSFDMSGFSITRGQGERQTAGSLYVLMNDLPPDVAVTMKISYIGKSGRLDHGDAFKFTNFEQMHFWELPDDLWGDNDANMINLEITTNAASYRDIKIKYIKLQKKDMQVKTFKIADDGQFVFEGIYREPWWLKETAMKVEVVDDFFNATDFHDIANLRVYMKKPYEDGYSQIFVIHDDGHSRLQPVAPHGIDWTPFGTSFILGPNTPDEVRPYASIKSITIKPSKLRMKINYQDGSTVTLRLDATPTSTTIRIVKYSTPADTKRNALVTVLSTWIDDGYSFVDHMSVDGTEEHIIKNMSDSPRQGRRVRFYRKCISRLNTLSPDIEISAPIPILTKLNSDA